MLIAITTKRCSFEKEILMEALKKVAAVITAVSGIVCLAITAGLGVTAIDSITYAPFWRASLYVALISFGVRMVCLCVEDQQRFYEQQKKKR